MRIFTTFALDDEVLDVSFGLARQRGCTPDALISGLARELPYVDKGSCDSD